MTEGIAPERGAVPAVALGALVEARIAARGLADVSVVGGWGGWRLRVLVGSPAEGSRAIEAVRAAMLAPVQKDEPALESVSRKLSALARRPLADRALVEVARCTGEAFGTGGDAPPSAVELESWRRAAHGLGRASVASAGDEALADSVAGALAVAPAWPAAAPVTQTSGAPEERAVVYDASGELAPGAARIVVTARTATAEQAVGAAPSLGDARGPLASRLAALDAPARVRSVVATAHADGGCVAATIDLASRDLGGDGPARIATAAALARQEITVELGDTSPLADLGRALALRAADPRDAAERAAWWTLAGRRAGGDEIRTGVTVGIAAARDATAAGATPSADLLRGELDRATIAWHSPAVEVRARVERGQGEAWLLLASPCGTLAETVSDAGAGAAVAMAAASQAGAAQGDARIEPVVATDSVGVLAHGPARPGESPQAHARRLADIAARAFAADALDAQRVTQARTSLLVQAGQVDARALGELGAALAPGHPSWIAPFGTTTGLSAASEDAIALRAAAFRSGPLRVALIANVDDAQAQAAARAVDRWIARRPGETRACPPAPTLPMPRAGTYAVEAPAGALSEALVTLPLPADDETSRVAAPWIAAALDGSDGLLAHALGSAPGSSSEDAMARRWAAAVVGAPRRPALVVRLVATDASLDAAVAQTRALLDRLRQGALREEDRARAASALARSVLAVSLDPRARALELWRGATPAPAPSLDALRAFAASALRDDALVIVAARPPRLDPNGRPFPGRDPRVKVRPQGAPR
jgi:hypothetical protein